MTGEPIPRYSYTYIKGDYDENHLPGINDVYEFDSLSEAKRDLEIWISQNNLVREHYVFMRSYCTPWEVIDANSDG